MKKLVYFDNASTTSLDSKVLDKMLPYLQEFYGNANSSHSLGRLAIKGLDEAREIISSLLNVNFNEIYFTSGGTESDNWVLRGMAQNRGKKNKLILSSIEHLAMLKTSENLQNQGVKVVYINPDKNGIINPKDYSDNLDDCFLASLMYANNEIGSVQPIKEVASLVHEKGSYFYTDAVQAVGTIKIDCKDLGVDMLGFSAHKFNGPKGVGGLFIKNGTPISPIITGGHQERSLRGGTSNVAGAIGMAYALKYTYEYLDKNNEYLEKLQNYFIDKVKTAIPTAKLNGSLENRLKTNVNFLFEGIDGEVLLNKLDLNGVCASLGSACSAGSIRPSHVLKAIGLTEKEIFSSIRFSISKDNTFEEVDYCVEVLKKLINELNNFN